MGDFHKIVYDETCMCGGKLILTDMFNRITALDRINAFEKKHKECAVRFWTPTVTMNYATSVSEEKKEDAQDELSYQDGSILFEFLGDKWDKLKDMGFKVVRTEE